MQIAGYRLAETIGRGGSGVVSRAVDAEGREVAVKLLRGGKDPRGALSRFRRESELQSLLDGRGFVPLLHAGDSPYGPYLIMPLLRGGSLAARLEEGPLPPAAAVELVRTLASAMGRAHALKVVHRDLKPGNVLFDGEGRPLIADLGLAKRFTSDASQSLVSEGISRTGEARGTAGYLAPEQLTDSKSVGPAADVFALGAILYECLAGVPAFAGRGVVEVLQALRRAEYVPLTEVCPDLAPEVAAAVTQALDPDPGRRPADGAELARLLGARPDTGAAGVVGLPLAIGILALVAVGCATLTAIYLSPGSGGSPGSPPVSPSPSASPLASPGRSPALKPPAEAELLAERRGRAAELRLRVARALETELGHRELVGAALTAAEALRLDPHGPPPPVTLLNRLRAESFVGMSEANPGWLERWLDLQSAAVSLGLEPSVIPAIQRTRQDPDLDLVAALERRLDTPAPVPADALLLAIIHDRIAGQTQDDEVKERQAERGLAAIDLALEHRERLTLPAQAMVYGRLGSTLSDRSKPGRGSPEERQATREATRSAFLKALECWDPRPDECAAKLVTLHNEDPAASLRWAREALALARWRFALGPTPESQRERPGGVPPDRATPYLTPEDHVLRYYPRLVRRLLDTDHVDEAGQLADEAAKLDAGQTGRGQLSQALVALWQGNQEQGVRLLRQSVRSSSKQQMNELVKQAQNDVDFLMERGRPEAAAPIADQFLGEVLRPR